MSIIFIDSPQPPVRNCPNASKFF